MDYETVHKIKGWESNGERWEQFIKRISGELLRRIKDALSLNWLKEQFYIFKLRNFNTHKLYYRVLSIVLRALNESGLSEAFHTKESIQIALQTTKNQVLLIKKNRRTNIIQVDFIFKTTPTFKTFHIVFDRTSQGFGDITMTKISYHRLNNISGSGGGAAGPALPERMFSHIAQLLLNKPEINDIQILGVEVV